VLARSLVRNHRANARRADEWTTLLPHTTHPPPAPSSALHTLNQAAGPPRLKAAVAWVQAGAHAGTVASLAQAFLKASDAHAIECFLRTGHHDQAAKCFCERFSERLFPLEYAHTQRGDLIVELASGIEHEGWGENWQEWGDLWSLKPVFALSWALMEDSGWKSSRPAHARGPGGSVPAFLHWHFHPPRLPIADRHDECPASTSPWRHERSPRHADLNSRFEPFIGYRVALAPGWRRIPPVSLFPPMRPFAGCSRGSARHAAAT
jgi:hypothetical protein